MKKILICILIFNFTINSFSTDCSEIGIFEEQKIADAIFFGEIIYVDPINDKFCVKVNEVLKGKHIDTISCIWGDKYPLSIYPKEGAIWFMYANKTDSSTFFINKCGNSFQINANPKESYFSLPYPIKYGENIDLNYLQKEISRYASLNEMYFKILFVYQSNQYPKINNFSSSNDESINYNVIYISLLSLILLFQVILIFRKG